jgi:hypothetical protein
MPPAQAREDTVLFPALRTILKPKQVEELGERMEEEEKKVLGDEGFEKSVEQVATIEKQLGIYETAMRLNIPFTIGVWEAWDCSPSASKLFVYLCK